MSDGALPYLLTVPESGRFFRLLKGATPSVDDFRSNRELGKRARLPSEHWMLWAGISALISKEHAIERALLLNSMYPKMAPFTHVAEVVTSGRRGHGCARTLLTDGHWTIWGQADDLCYAVRNVFAIGE